MIGKIVVQEVKEHEDGSVTVVFECDEAAKQALISEGLLSLIEKAIDIHSKEYDWKDDRQIELDLK